MLQLKVKKLHPNAKLPYQAHVGDAGYDLFSLEGGVVPARSKAMIKTGICIDLPKPQNNFGVVGFIKSRSGLSARHNLETGAGVIDYCYNQELQIILHNHSDTDFEFLPATRIAQLVILPIINVNVVNVTENGFEDSGRGGFGSSGLH
jgi:dUTP pyrophosphatase